MQFLMVSAQCMRRHPVLTVMLLMMLGLGIASWCLANRQIVINTSSSVPQGLYVRSDEPPRVGLLIDFEIPAAARDYIQSRTGSDGNHWYILKPIVAGPGDCVDTTGDWLIINDCRIASMVPVQDAQGRALPRWQAKQTLGEDEFFVYSARIANSFDSRCYGPIQRGQIDAVRKPWITW